MDNQFVMLLLKMEDLANAVKYSRKQQGLSQVELATQLGVSQRFISELEQGKPKRLDNELIFLLRRMGLDLSISMREPNG